MSAARESHMENAPLWEKPFGVWACSDCGGSGQVSDIEAWVRDWWNSMSLAEQEELRTKLSEQLAKLTAKSSQASSSSQGSG